MTLHGKFTLIFALVRDLSTSESRMVKLQ